jgi:hypothetical protein
VALAAALVLHACSDDSESGAGPQDAGADVAPGSGGVSGAAGSGGGTGGSSGASGSAGTTADADAGDPGPNVDRQNPELHALSFGPDDADPQADEVLGTQLAFLDTRVPARGILVVYLHGAGTPSTCGSQPHGEMLAGLGFHVLSPCYHSGYGVGNCGDDIEGCRLEAFEGIDHHPFIDVSPPNSIEGRVAKGLAYLDTQIPQGDWTYFLDAGAPRWEKILLSGISHGASSSAVIGLHRTVARVVMLSGPLDTGQAWLDKTPNTPIDRYWALSHTDDGQHPGHLQAFESLGLPGSPTSVDGASPPYGNSHRLISSEQTSDGHGAVQAGGSSPQDAGGDWVYLPVWTQLYTGS